MTVVFIKRECDRHPGCYTMSDRCERCIEDDFAKRIAAIFRDPSSHSHDGGAS